MRTNLRFVARAIDWPSDVLPTPGGPTRQRIGPFRIWTRCCTARYSTMRSLTLSSPKWSSFRTFSALALLHLLLDAAPDALLDLQHVQLAFDQGEDVLEPTAHVLDLEHLLLRIQLERHVRGNRVGEPARLFYACEGGQDLGRHLAVE